MAGKKPPQAGAVTRATFMMSCCHEYFESGVNAELTLQIAKMAAADIARQPEHASAAFKE